MAEWVDEWIQQVALKYPPCAVPGTGSIEMIGTCSQLQRNSQSNRARCHITKSIPDKSYNKGKEQWS